MDPITGGLIAGGSSLLGSIFSSFNSKSNNDANIAMQQQTNLTNIAENQKNRDFQQQMSSTAYQRASKDMTDAGLNPAMMFGSGSAASTPSGGTPNIQSPRKETTSPLAGLGDSVTKAVSSAVSLKTMDKMADEMANLQAENAAIRAKTENIGAQTATERAREVLTRQSANETKEDVERKRRDVPRQEWDAIKHLDLSGIDDSTRKWLNRLSWSADKVSDTISPLASSALGIKRLLPKVTTREGARSVAPDGKSFDEFWKYRTQ